MSIFHKNTAFLPLFGILLSLLLFGCDNSRKEVELMRISSEGSPELNKQLATDLASYHYQVDIAYELKDEIPSEMLRNITFSSIPTGTSGEYAIQMTLSKSPTISKQELILPIVRNKMKWQQDMLHRYDSVFQNAENMALVNIDLLNHKKNEQFWGNTSQIFKGNTDKETMLRLLEKRNTFFNAKMNPKIYCRTYYNQLPGIEGIRDYFIVCYQYEGINAFEQFTFQKGENGLEITGYDYHMPS